VARVSAARALGRARATVHSPRARAGTGPPDEGSRRRRRSHLLGHGPPAGAPAREASARPQAEEALDLLSRLLQEPRAVRIRLRRCGRAAGVRGGRRAASFIGTCGWDTAVGRWSAPGDADAGRAAADRLGSSPGPGMRRPTYGGPPLRQYLRLLGGVLVADRSIPSRRGPGRLASWASASDGAIESRRFRLRDASAREAHRGSRRRRRPTVRGGVGGFCSHTGSRGSAHCPHVRDRCT